MPRYAVIAGVLLIALSVTADVRAQDAGARMTVEAVASIATTTAAFDDPSLFVDVAGTFRLGGGFDAVVRPFVRRLSGGDWDGQLYQFQVRYQTATRVPLRVDAGIITSPLGLGTLELRPDLNPGISSPFYYFAPLPRFDEYFDQVQILAGGYPLGAMVSSSGDWWDARAGITDGTPARYRKIFASGGPGPMPQVVAGGGVSVLPGLRVGAGFANGKYRDQGDFADDPDYYQHPDMTTAFRDARATVVNLEAEYAMGYTKVSGEWVRNRFEAPGSAPAVARGFYVQGVHTFTPRLFGFARLVRSSTPVLTGAARERLAMTTWEANAGFRVTSAWTARAGYRAVRRYGGREWDHAAAISIVWARRWF